MWSHGIVEEFFFRSHGLQVFAFGNSKDFISACPLWCVQLNPSITAADFIKSPESIARPEVGLSARAHQSSGFDLQRHRSKTTKMRAEQ